MIQASLFNDRVGPICRTVRDTSKVLDVIAGYDESDELTAFSVRQLPQQPYSSFTNPLLVDRPLSLKGITVGVIREWDVPWTVADQESVNLFEGVIQEFENLGATIIDPGPGNNLFDDVIPQLYPYLEPAAAATAGIDTTIPGLIDLWFDTSLYPTSVDAPNIRALPSNGPASGELTYVLGRYLRGRGDSNIQTIILTYDIKTDVYTAIGNVKAVEGTTTLTGDVISLHNRSHIHAIGHVHLIDLDSNIVASEGTLDLATEEATLYHAKVYAFDRSYYLTGTKIQKTLGQHYRAENALLTTCTCDMRSATKSDRGCMFPSAGFMPHADGAACKRRAYRSLKTWPEKAICPPAARDKMYY